MGEGDRGGRVFATLGYPDRKYGMVALTLAWQNAVAKGRGRKTVRRPRR